MTEIISHENDFYFTVLDLNLHGRDKMTRRKQDFVNKGHGAKANRRQMYFRG